jgi:hypothetical protein
VLLEASVDTPVRNTLQLYQEPATLKCKANTC